MQTYYQKHRKIQAFQFDGTYQQLANELPPHIWNHWLYIYQHQQIRTAEFDVNRKLSSLVIGDHTWPFHKYAKKTSIFTPQILTPGKYIVYYSNQTTHYQPVITFQPAPTFESHWSKQPRKPKRKD